jgi:hypothetical protein
MNYLTLDEIKKQVVIDSDFTDDDEFLTMIGDAAEDMVGQLLDCPLYELEAEKGEIPPTIRHCLRMLVDYFYSTNRGSAETDKGIPEAVTLMIKLYRNYN